jgi:hypothetical protein
MGCLRLLIFSDFQISTQVYVHMFTVKNVIRVGLYLCRVILKKQMIYIFHFYFSLYNLLKFKNPRKKNHYAVVKLL